ncbi:ABC transporter permease [Mucilaginibacter agri]|uniref:FtsX-like permease family protein n=1 Tax=Mucilaginibacter agri TaxID=2695265 RepID=A0A965ZES9_9SPHI|nr:ABC transporter permease [Mucilaginibacter agri]NCD68431.1 FtsX-like permease family protein [Mucilaginibacter agri]
MIKSYFKIAWRNLSKHKIFSMINVFGLAIGIASFWIIALYVTDELSYDRFNTKADRIFRVAQHGTWNGGKFDLAVTSAPYAPALKAEYPEVEDVVRINTEGGGKISVGEKELTANNIIFSDNSIFNIFSYHFLYGDPKSALAKPQSIVLTKSMAVNLFGDASQAINKTVLFDGNVPNMVSGVIDDVPANSHLTFGAIRYMPQELSTGKNWQNSELYTYVLLKHHNDYQKIEGSTTRFLKKYNPGGSDKVHFRMELQPLTSIHLHSKLDYELSENGNVMYVYVFTLIGLLILGIAIINYVNLATARSSIRVKEIGVRKVIGSDRVQLMMLFFAESVLLAALATGLAVVVIHTALPFFNQLSGKALTLMQFGTWQTVGLFAGFALFTGGLAGVYPALFLSGFKTIPAMKGQMGNQASTVLFRKSLVVFQFIITMVMITGSCVIYTQLHYVMNKDLGFNKDQILTFHIHSRDVRAKVASLKSQLLQNPLIQSVAVAGNPIGNNDIGTGDFSLDVGDGSASKTVVENLIIDEDFVPTMQIKMLQGRNFINNSDADRTGSVLVNETLVKEMGLKNPVGKTVRTQVNYGGAEQRTIVGVIKDFNTYSLQHKISPMVLAMPTESKDGDNLYVRINKNNVSGALSYIRKVYATFDPDKLDFNFLDQNFARNYQTEQKQGSLLLIFTILAISIACLGLFGLVTFTAQQRNKEIGIRKILGASVGNIVNMLSKDLIKLVIIAAVVACPIAWWAMQTWLQGFAYRINIQLWMFALASGVAILIAFATIGFQSVRAALANPVRSLRNE